MHNANASDTIAILSFRQFGEGQWVVYVHDFQGHYSLSGGARAWCGRQRQQLHGEPVENFLNDVLTSHYKSRGNKVTVVAVLNTWIWAQVIGQDGEPRSSRMLFRHTMQHGDGGTPFWSLVVDTEFLGESTKYKLVPHTDFTCRCGQRFERYPQQKYHDLCPACNERMCEFDELAHELLAVGEDSDRGRAIFARMERLNVEMGFEG